MQNYSKKRKSPPVIPKSTHNLNRNNSYPPVVYPPRWVATVFLLMRHGEGQRKAKGGGRGNNTEAGGVIES